jgi:hypothetical protein
LRSLVSLLLLWSVACLGFGFVAAALPVSAGSVAAGSGAAVEDVAESSLAYSSRRRSARLAVSRRASRVDRGWGSPSVSGRSLAGRLAQWLRRVPPAWRGPPVLLI